MTRPSSIRVRTRTLRCRPGLRASLLALCTLLTVDAARAGEIRFWVDDQGVTHFSDDPESLPDTSSAGDRDLETLRSAWSDGITGPPLDASASDSSEGEGRVRRLLRGALADLERGEIARADSTLQGVLRLEPRRPEAHWYLSVLARGRGRFRAAEYHLRIFLDEAGPEWGSWKDRARERLAAFEDERRLADPDALEGPLRLTTLRNEDFRLQIDSRLGEVAPAYAERVMRFLGEARSEVSEAVGVEPLEPLGVVLYGKAAYVRAHAHRFSFQTIGFFDGRIHVASPAHPTPALRGVLFHEYTHAVFREHTGGDRPYWLNEGLAEQIERVSRGRPISTRSERAALRAHVETGAWIPLREISASFSGLTDERARDAYLQSVVTVGYIRSKTTVADRKRLLHRIGDGLSIDQALHETMGLDMEGLDRAVQAALRAEFPDWALPAAPEKTAQPDSLSDASSAVR